MAAAFRPEWLEQHRVHLPPMARSEVIGIGHVMSELDSVLARLHQPDLARSLGLELPRGILLWGEPGLGKSLVARYLATHLGEGVPFFEVASDELTPDRLRKGIRWLAEQFERSVLFLDEIDQFGLHRDAEAHSPETRLLLTAALASLDGVVSTPGPIVLASSNRSPRALDPALVRAGRLGFHIRFDHPDESERVQLLTHFIAGRPTEGIIDLDRAARLTRGRTPADIRAMTDDGFGLALAAGRRALAGSDLVAAIRRAGDVIPEDDVDDPDMRRRLAYHEAGHVSVACALPRRGPAWVYSVTVGAAAGTTKCGPEGRPLRAIPDDELLDHLVVAFGGIAAERILLDGGPCLGGEEDVQNATKIAMARLDGGLDPSVPPVAVDEMGLRTSEALRREQGRAVGRLLDEARERASRIVAANVAGIEAFAAVLESARELVGDALREATSGRFVDEQGNRVT